MDPSAPAALPWLVLGAALVGLVVLAAIALPRGRTRSSPGRPAEAAAPLPAYRHDDLPGFLEAPPGTPAPVPPVAARPPDAPGEPAGTPGRTLAALTAAALVLVAAAALVAGTAPGAPDTPGAAAPGAQPAAPVPSAPPGPPAGPPELPGVPADPLPGERGAGALASRSVPLGEEGVAARLSFGGVVLERHAVGIAVGYPSVGLTATPDGAGGTTALAHLRLPTWNCLGVQAPADPVEAGCVPTGVELADLPSPALTVTREGHALRATGRFPTWTRPPGRDPRYTGRVYELTVTAAPEGPVSNGRAAAEGTFFLGTERAGSRGERNALTFAG